jgi:hypothetical protein
MTKLIVAFRNCEKCIKIKEISVGGGAYCSRGIVSHVKLSGQSFFFFCQIDNVA